MKKIVCILFLSLLIIGSVFAADTDYTGIWYLDSVTMDGENFLNVADLGAHSEMKLDENGTVEMNMNLGGESETAQGTWSVTDEGIVIVFEDAEPTTAVLKDIFLVIDTYDNGMMIYGREEPVPGFELAEPDEKAKAEDYEGTWAAFKVGMDEVGFFDWDLVSADMGVSTNESVIKDGVLTIFGLEENPIQLTFEEGGVMANRFENREYDTLDTVATLREDGTMTVQYMTMTFVLEKVEKND